MAAPTSIYSRPPPINTVGGAAPLTHHEWRTASNSAQYLLPSLHHLCDVNPRLKLLDIGCGSGSITATLALEIPMGHVTGVDSNPSILERAHLVATSWKASNVTFQEGDVAVGLPFEDASFDVVHCHQVLAWLKEPWATLREMLRVCKPGGLVSAREGDLQTEAVWPEMENLRKFHNMTEALMRLAGGSPDAGRQLLGWALKAGIKRDHVTVSWGSWGYSNVEEKKVWCK